MMATAGYIAYILGDMKYSLYNIFIRRVFYNDCRGYHWLCNNSFYLWYIILVSAMIGTSLMLIGQFMANDIFDKPGWIFSLAAILWISAFISVKKTHERSLKRHN